MVIKEDYVQLEKELMRQHVKKLTDIINEKDAEIEKLEYFITSLSLSLKLSSDYILTLRKQLQKTE